MKLEIDLPDWCDERHLYFFAGQECFAYRLYPENILYLKTERCSVCGNCCRGQNPILPNIGPSGSCIYLGAAGVDNECGLNVGDKPFRCCIDVHKPKTPGCTIEHKVVKF